MAAIFQTTFSNAFSWMKIVVFCWKFHWNLFPEIQLIAFQHWFRQWLAVGQARSPYLSQWWLNLYASLSLNELITPVPGRYVRHIYGSPHAVPTHHSEGEYQASGSRGWIIFSQKPQDRNQHRWHQQSCIDKDTMAGETRPALLFLCVGNPLLTDVIGRE